MTRIVRNDDEIINILNYVKNGTFATMGYVTQVSNFNFPKKIKPKNQNDYEKFYGDLKDELNDALGNGKDISGIIKLTRYNFQFMDRQHMNRMYGIFAPERDKRYNAAGTQKSEPHSQDKEDINYGQKGVEQTSLGKIVSRQNMYNARITSKFFAVYTDGTVGNEIDPEILKGRWKPESKKELTLKAQICKQLEDEMKYRYQNFLTENILYFATTDQNGEKILYINDYVDSVKGISHINSQDLVKIAKKQYRIEEKRMRHSSFINENILRNKIKKYVREALYESMRRY